MHVSTTAYGAAHAYSPSVDRDTIYLATNEHDGRTQAAGYPTAADLNITIPSPEVAEQLIAAATAVIDRMRAATLAERDEMRAEDDAHDEREAAEWSDTYASLAAGAV